MKEVMIRGQRPLAGEVHIHGAKNAVLPILAASLLTKDEILIKNCPRLSDVEAMLAMLENAGSTVSFTRDGLLLQNGGICNAVLDRRCMRSIRSSIFLLGPLLARHGQATFCCPGGCDIGRRPIDLHLKGLRELGVKVQNKEDCIECETTGLHGGEVLLDYPSVGATENLMMVSVFADGATLIRNPAREPEIVELQGFLNAMGARVQGAGSHCIVIHGVRKLHGAVFTCMPDRIVTGTYLIACALCGKELFLHGAVAGHDRALIRLLKDDACLIRSEKKGIYVKRKGRMQAVPLLETAPYPGFPTDLQSPMLTLLSVAEGESMVRENVFENRFRLADELDRMGARITVNENCACVTGVDRLHGACVTAHDLRSGAAVVLAALTAEGESYIYECEKIDRGYENWEAALLSLGADIRLVPEQ